MSTTVPHIESVPHERPDEPTGPVGLPVDLPIDLPFDREVEDALSPMVVPVLGALFIVAGVVTASSVLVSTGVVLLVLAGGAWLMRGE